MSTTPRPELSVRNEWYLPRHRFYELRHFCLQYKGWNRARAALDGYKEDDRNLAIMCQKGQMSDPTATVADARLFYTNRIEMIEHVAMETDPVIGPFILSAVTEGISYDILNARRTIPCGKDMFYDLYHKFFWLLSKERK